MRPQLDRLFDSAFDPSSRAVFAAMTSPPTAGRKRLIDRTIRRLKAAGLWSQIDCMYVMAAADSQAALVDWMKPSRTATPVNSPTFTADRGYAGDAATSYLTSGYIPNIDKVAVSLNSIQIGVYTRSVHGGNARINGGLGTGSNALNVSVFSSTGGTIRGAADFTPANAVPIVPTSVGLTIAQRSGTACTFWKNGLLFDTVSAPTLATSLATTSIAYIGGNNNSGVAQNLSSDQHPLFFIAAAFTDQGHADFKSIMVDGYLTSVGAA